MNLLQVLCSTAACWCVCRRAPCCACSACRFVFLLSDLLQARHRGSTEIDAKDVVPHIERHWGVPCEAHRVDLTKK